MNAKRLLRNQIIHALTVVVYLTLCGCSYFKSDKPEVTETRLQLTFAASTIINGCDDVSSAPVQLRLYELNSDGLFNQADFLDLFKNDSAMLQNSLIKRHLTPTVWPGSHKTISLTLDPDTTSLAVLAEFSDYLSAVSKAVQVIKRGEMNTLTLHIEENRLRFTTSSE